MSLNSSRAVGLIARREISQRLRDKAFIISTGFIVVVILGIVLAPQLFGDGDDERRLGVSGKASRPLAEALENLPQSASVSVETRSFPDEADATAAV